MTVTRGFALFLTIAVAGTLLQASGPGGGSAAPAAPAARLKAISARVSAKGASLVIEASEPVAYVATRPDPLTVLLDFRNVGAEGLTTAVAADDRSPIAGVTVESAESLGAPASRVRVVLAQPVVHRVRSDRNTVVIDFDKLAATAAPYVLPPAALETAAPDAMMALQPRVQTTVVGPLAVTGISAAFGGPSVATAQAAGSATTRAPLPSEAATAQPTEPAQPVGGASTGRQYTGNPVSLDFQGADLRAVLRTFAEISGLNMVIDPKVTGTVDVALRDVAWDQALDIILRANGLDWRVDGTIVRIAPIDVFTAEDKQLVASADAQAAAVPLSTITKQLSYAKAEELRALLTTSALSSRGTVQVDPRTNTLIITDVSDRLQTASDLIATLDRAQPQVEIEARIVQTNRSYARALGVQWGFLGKVDPALGNTTNLAFPNNGSLGGRTGGAQGGNATGGAQPTATNFPVSAATSALGLALGSVNGAFNLDVALSALESSGNGRVLSTPRVTTQNNVAAEMKQGVQIPIQTVANNTVTVSFKDAALVLQVTPQITAADTVIMQVSLENASPDFSRAVNGIPPINTQSARTQVLVSDGQTTVIGGINTSTEQTSTDRTPGLGSLPILRWLFKRDTVDEENRELLIFITPRIIK
jgi:type IV pilus assembly protein PilQ